MWIYIVQKLFENNYRNIPSHVWYLISVMGANKNGNELENHLFVDIEVGIDEAQTKITIAGGADEDVYITKTEI